MRRATVAALAEQRAATLSQLERLPAPAWDLACLPPWRVRDVVAHLVTVDEAAASGRLLVRLARSSRSGLERWNDSAVASLAGLGPPELAERLRRSGGRLVSRCRRVPPGLDRLRLPTAWGRLSLHALACRRVLDEWVHSADVAGATGMGATLAPGVPAALATAVLATLPARVLPRVERPVGVLRLVVGTGTDPGWQASRQTWGVDFARRQYGPRVAAAPDATVHVHASTLALLSERRMPWRALAPGALVVEGDPDVAAGLLDPLGAG